MLCAKYQEAGLCGSRENCDRNYLVSKFAYVHNIQSRVKQCLQPYSFDFKEFLSGLGSSLHKKYNLLQSYFFLI